MTIDPARLAVIRDVLNEMGIDVQSDEEVINALDLVRVVFAERRLRDKQYERLVALALDFPLPSLDKPTT